jgi:cytidine deaminase
MEEVKFELLPERDRELINSAKSAARNAYAPYSGFAVGSAVRTASGRIVGSCNVENASYGVTICAEVGALAAAATIGEFAAIEAIAVVGFRFLPGEDMSQVVVPCGRCRQLIAEASHLSGRDIVVFAGNADLSRIEQYRISELLPHSFTPTTLGVEVPPSTTAMPIRKAKISHS